MSSKNITTIHPQVYSLLNLKDQCRGLMIARQYKLAIRVMEYIYFEIETKDRDMELVTKLNSEIITLDGFAYPSGSKNRVNTMESMYKKWWEQILITLRTKGYLTNAKYGFVLKDDDIKFE